MCSSVDLSINNSIGNALYHATVQLTVPTVTTTSSITTKFRSNSASNESPEISKTGFSLSSLSISFPKHSHLNKRKIVRDTTPQPVIHKSQSHSNDFESTMISSSPTKDYLSSTKYYKHSRSTSCSSRKHNKSIKTTLFGIWQGLNNNEIQSPINPKRHSGERRRKIKWRVFSKVVVSLLTFTRTKKGRYEWIQLVGHPGNKIVCSSFFYSLSYLGTFKEGIHDGYVLKELCEYERDCCQVLQNDALKNFVPKYNGTVKDDEGKCKKKF
jgi:hypothetical protein